MSGSLHTFVYGTLRAGEVNDLRRAAARHSMPAPVLVGAAEVDGILYDFGDYPGMVRAAGQGRVRGEVYRIAPALVPVLDEIEEVYPGQTGLFVREQVAVTCAGEIHDCIVYPVAASAVAGRPRIESGDWVAHRLARA